jgi:hypothetical protein
MSYSIHYQKHYYTPILTTFHQIINTTKYDDNYSYPVHYFLLHSYCLHSTFIFIFYFNYNNHNPDSHSYYFLLSFISTLFYSPKVKLITTIHNNHIHTNYNQNFIDKPQALPTHTIRSNITHTH